MLRLHPKLRGRLLIAAALLLGTLSFPMGSGLTQALARISVSPSKGPPGTRVQVSGSGFAPNGSAVNIRWNGSGGSVLATATVSPGGTFSVQIVIPNATPGNYVIVATQSNAEGRPNPGTPARTAFRVEEQAQAPHTPANPSQQSETPAAAGSPATPRAASPSPGPTLTPAPLPPVPAQAPRWSTGTPPNDRGRADHRSTPAGESASRSVSPADRSPALMVLLLVLVGGVFLAIGVLLGRLGPRGVAGHPAVVPGLALLIALVGAAGILSLFLTDSSDEKVLTDQDVSEALLTLGDLPTGWTAQQPSPEAGDGNTICPEFDPERHVRPVARATAQFQAGQVGPFAVHAVVAYKSEKDARRAMDLVEQGLEKCRNFSGTSEGQTLTGSFSAASFPNLGDETLASNLRAQAQGEAGTLRLSVAASGDVVIVRTDQVLSSLVHLGLDVPLFSGGKLTPETLEQLARIAESRQESLVD